MKFKWRDLFKRLGILLVVLSSLLTAKTAQAQDVSFDITHATVQGQITDTGAVTLQTTYDYDIDSMNGAILTIYYGEGSIQDYEVGIVDPVSGDFLPFEQAYTSLPGTYSVKDDGSSLEFRLYYPAQDTELQFVIKYTMSGLVTNYSDTAQYYQQIFSEVDEDGFSVEGRIALPGPIENTDDFRVWGYGSPRGSIYPVTEGGQAYIDLDVPLLGQGEFVEVKSLFPTSLTPNNQQFEEKNIFQEVIAQEDAQVSADRASYQKHNYLFGFFIIALLGGGLFLLVYTYSYYFRCRRENKQGSIQVPEHVYSLPEDLTPAIMATAVLRTKPKAQDFAATILDLSRKGFIELKEIPRKQRGMLKRGDEYTIQVKRVQEAPDDELLMGHERHTLDYLFPDDEDETTLEKLEGQIQQSSTYRKKQGQTWTRFSDFVELRGQMARGGPNGERNRSQVLAWLTLIASILGGLIAFALLDNLYISDKVVVQRLTVGLGIVYGLMIILSIVLIILVIYRPILTPKEERMDKEWAAFANMLRDVGQFDMREIASLPLWEEYLVYAVSLGVADKVLDQMKSVYAVEELDTLKLPTSFYVNPYLLNHIFYGSINSSVKASSSSVSGEDYSGNNLGGFGGGFSSGGGGGSGGSSAGGF